MQNTWLENRIHKWHYDHLEGGGGEVGRFTTAKITITNGDSKPISLNGAFCIEDGPLAAPISIGVMPAAQGTDEVDIILFDGAAFLSANTTMNDLILTGNITYNATFNCLIVTGDCTISKQ